ncbi:MAG: GGDEF domain-containing protein [Methylophilaceae bacterium]
MKDSTNKLSMQDAIDFELLKIYLHQSRIAVYCALGLALYLAASFYHVASVKSILLWIFLIFSINFYTIYTSFQFNLDLPIYEVGFFKKRQHFLHFLSGLAWGSAFYILVDSNTPVSGSYRIAVAIAIVMAISSSSKAASFKGLLGFIIAVSAVPAWYFTSHFPDFSWWFFGLIGLASMSLFFGWMTNRYILGQVEHVALNAGYVEELRTLHDKIEKTNEDFLKRNLELQDIQEQLRLLASNDVLTGLHNRRYILERIEEKLPEIRRHQLDCCFVIMDVDYFKDVNDNYGHIAGDDVLKAIAQILVSGIRQGDIVARYGGEEFLIFLPMTELESAHVLVERLRLALEQHLHKVGHERLTVTASFGIAQHEINDSANRTIARADKALYEAKIAGRNRIMRSPKPV